MSAKSLQQVLDLQLDQLDSDDMIRLEKAIENPRFIVQEFKRTGRVFPGKYKMMSELAKEGKIGADEFAKIKDAYLSQSGQKDVDFRGFVINKPSIPQVQKSVQTRINTPSEKIAEAF